MLQAASVQPSNYSLRIRRKSESRSFPDEFEMSDDNFEDEGDGGSKGRNKSRRELPAGAVATLKAWLLSPEHFTHPYPTPQDQAMLMDKTGIDKKQLKNWFTNARRRIWKPMLKKQIEQGKLTAAPGMPGVPGLMIPSMTGASAMNGSMDNPHSVQAMRAHYQQAVQQQQQSQEEAIQQSESYSNTLYSSAPTGQFYGNQPDGMQSQMTASSSIGTLPQISSSAHLTKTDSHAVLMELFARDQDLVRQATESARIKAEQNKQQVATSPAPQAQPSSQTSSQHPMQAPFQGSMPSAPTLNSWPHFSSITSLNNLGNLPGVKSITSLSGADLASKGNLNRMGNLAQVKSMESIGKTDSYAFLEVFFGNPSSGNLSGLEGQNSRGMKMPGGTEEDNEIGMFLDDESPSQAMTPRKDFNASATAPPPQTAPQAASPQDFATDSGTLKRAYDDALAARGLMAVSRSSERLTDLVLPEKMQRSLSQEFISKQRKLGPGLGQGGLSMEQAVIPPHPSSQYPGQQPAEPTAGAEEDGQVKVPLMTRCALCNQTNVDTQLRPCGHMFHERCLKPSLQTPMGPPVCPCDNVPMQSALLAVPCEDAVAAPTGQLKSSSSSEFPNTTV